MRITVSTLLDERTSATGDDAAATYAGHNLVFIVGCSRSGTTWLQRLLASHPQVSTGQESFLFYKYVGPQLRAWREELRRASSGDPSAGRGGVGLSCYFREEEFAAVLRSYMLRLLEPMIGNLQPSELFVEKSPQHALFIPEIKQLLPDSRVIHIMRDPRDVAASLMAASRSWGSEWAPRRPHRAARMWTQHVRAVREDAKDLPASEYCELKYEELWAAPEATLKKVSDFLGLEWTGNTLQDAVTANRAEAVRSGGGTPLRVYGEVAKRIGSVVREPADFVRSGRPGGWKHDLSPWERLVVWFIARKTMREVGYS